MNGLQFTFLSMPTFEYWDWRNPDTKGIGGSETSHVMMCEGLAATGADVWSFAPGKFERPELGPGGVPWRWSELAWELPAAQQRRGVWVVYRDPEAIDKAPEGAAVWHVCQDCDYEGWTDARIARCSRIIALCEMHKRFLEFRHPGMRGKVFVSSNGIRADVIADALALGLPRNPKRLIYASSPDRGLMNLIPVLDRARELDPEIELHVYYGFDNLERIMERERAILGDDGPVQRSTRRILDAVKSPGVVVHGRLGQRELAKEWAQAGIWCHPTNFEETSCITSMDAQALGAVPITNPIWAIGENVRHGVLIDGNAANNVVRGRYAVELVNLARDPERQERIRRLMMQDALDRFCWSRFVDQWMQWAREDTRDVPAAAAPVEVTA